MLREWEGEINLKLIWFWNVLMAIIIERIIVIIIRENIFSSKYLLKCKKVNIKSNF